MISDIKHCSQQCAPGSLIDAKFIHSTEARMDRNFNGRSDHGHVPALMDSRMDLLIVELVRKSRLPLKPAADSRVHCWYLLSSHGLTISVTKTFSEGLQTKYSYQLQMSAPPACLMELIRSFSIMYLYSTFFAFAITRLNELEFECSRDMITFFAFAVTRLNELEFECSRDMIAWSKWGDPCSYQHV